MEDVEEAQRLIATIRDRRGVDRPGGSDEWNVQDLQESIRTLSNDLYATPLRFLLELIQNADDNSYGAEELPQFSILYRTDGFLWVGSNEKGFSASNVESICRIRHSTKKVEGGRKGYIGEKGIGFKSVFIPADLVWAKSNALEFRIDKTQPLGMITPQWCPFKRNAELDERTMFCFRIPSAEDQANIYAQIKSLEPELLLFLRQIRRISVAIQSPDGSKELAHNLRRADDNVGQLRTIKLLRESEDKSESKHETLVVCEHSAKNMPFEEKRIGVTESDVLIDRASKRPQHLPIKDYGLPFILQADFMLTASREDILRLNAWNRRLPRLPHLSAGHIMPQRYIIPPSWTLAIDRFLRRLTVESKEEKVLRFEAKGGYVVTPEN